MQLRRFAPHGLMISQKKIKSTGKVGNRRYSAPLHKNMKKNAKALSGTRINFHCAASVNHPTRFSLPMYILPGNALYCFRFKRLSRSEEYPWTSPRHCWIGAEIGGKFIMSWKFLKSCASGTWCAGLPLYQGIPSGAGSGEAGRSLRRQDRGVPAGGVVAEQCVPGELYAQNVLYTHMVNLQTDSRNWFI